MIYLERINHDMKYADHVRIEAPAPGVLRFTFIDNTGFDHGSFESGNPISPSPEGTINAIKKDGVWYWVIEKRGSWN